MFFDLFFIFLVFFTLVFGCLFCGVFVDDSSEIVVGVPFGSKSEAADERREGKWFAINVILGLLGGLCIEITKNSTIFNGYVIGFLVFDGRWLLEF